MWLIPKWSSYPSDVFVVGLQSAPRDICETENIWGDK